jgi:general secretion pathway protein A
MYESHFGLRTKPFAVTPDPRFLYQGRTHREALAALTYGVGHRRGFVCLIGEVGTGKTILLRALLERLDVSVRTVLITHTTLDREELVRMILHDLGVTHAGMTRVEMIQALQEYVLSELMARRPPPLLIVDEAQNLLEEVLEEIRLLTNLEIGDSKLLQVVLSGQPELERMLARPGLRQLGQRIAVRARLAPLDQAETMAYVKHRLHVAGARNLDLFSRRALRRVFWRTAGLPRLVNILCEQSLVNAFGAGEDRVEEGHVAEAARDLGLERPNGAARVAAWPQTEWRRPSWRSALGLGG